MVARKSTVSAVLGKEGTWRWEWQTPGGTKQFMGGFPSKRAALAAGRKVERKHHAERGGA